MLSKIKLLYQNRLSIIGTFTILLSLYFFAPTVLLPKNFLMPLEGTVKSSNVTSGIVSNEKKSGREIKSRQTTLTFSLNEFDNQFILSEGSSNPLFNGYNESDKIGSYLESSKKVVVWIKKWDLNNLNPEIFQIDIDGKTELKFETVRSKNQTLFLCQLLLGVFFIYAGNMIEKARKK
ncbi:hypothetical protein [Flavobacterium sp. FlaQc-50]|uniref:hypothetical protein n=1 Tax=unclassified Flavobacterium TaxID=196869 RepID=UPI003757FFEC